MFGMEDEKKHNEFYKYLYCNNGFLFRTATPSRRRPVARSIYSPSTHFNSWRYYVVIMVSTVSDDDSVPSNALWGVFRRLLYGPIIKKKYF